MKVWQGCLIAAGVFVLFIGAIVGVVFYATSGITDTADEFFAAAYDGDYDTAHSLTSQRLQEQGSPASLEQFLAAQGLDKVTETSWSSRNIENSTGSVEGTVTTESGAEIPILVEFVSENDEWKISYLEPKRVGMQTSGSSGGQAGLGSGAGALPGADYQIAHAGVVSTRFQSALSDPDFSEFLPLWVDQATNDFLEQNFAKLRPIERDIRMLRVTEPLVEPASEFDAEGFVPVKGHYQLENGRFEFEYTFDLDGENKLKLVGMNIDWVTPR